MSKLSINPTGRLTYRELKTLIMLMDEEQLDMDVTVEDKYENECFAGELVIAGKDHPSLDDFHPIIRFPLKEGE